MNISLQNVAEHQTVLEIKNPTYNIPMEESKFNVTTLEKGRF